MNRFEKLRIYLRSYALGKGWYRLVRVVEIANSVHTHTRKDGVTPEFQHQLEIAAYLITLSIATESLLIIAILHDLQEDYPEQWRIFQSELSTLLTPSEVNSLETLNKNLYDNTINYYAAVIKDMHAALVKGADRGNNIQTMAGAFSINKIREYISETETYVLPSLKEARRANPGYTQAFYNIETIIKNQIQLYKHFLDSKIT